MACPLNHCGGVRTERDVHGEGWGEERHRGKAGPSINDPSPSVGGRGANEKSAGWANGVAEPV